MKELKTTDTIWFNFEDRRENGVECSGLCVQYTEGIEIEWYNEVQLQPISQQLKGALRQ